MVSFVVPCFNEAANIAPLLAALDRVWATARQENPGLRGCEIVLVDDGSTDATWALIADAATRRPDTVAIRLSRNFGHQPALLAGLMAATGDAVISLDADLQDDIAVIPRMLAAHLRGDEIVFGVREDRSADTAFKRITAQGYYRLLAALGVDVLHNHADFRLMGRKSIEALRQHGEANLYLRGLIRSFGFRSSVVSYARLPRCRGESGYTLRRMLLLALDGITSFSVRPLRWIFYLGLVISVLAFGYILYAVFMALTGATVSGWASLVVSIYLIGGIQIMGIGILGEYLGRTYMETKRRPPFLIDEVQRHAKPGP
ncbi:glycosyltransferase [Rhodovulum strictum]|uniref:Glycosyltransferase n=2 Tax=Rhodovulum strictum TaxID=58314 RepID=A0A844BGS8_9RHOB|nr:glycosyltransferase [Rhodovulum strictum]